MPTTFTTLRDYASTYRIHADCPACHHHDWLNLMTIAQRVGWDAELSAVRKALRCSECGSGGVQISIIHDGRPAQ